ncbi:hypothetical protein F5884DRAFT_760469 [Xylogone sp. PMI_703]|nr:hypothetical protein F5884DRAFT_760469 [Xylogone sp. PMI_703]
MEQQRPKRSPHVNSRDGCKTCKRRHVRCDEGFPFCRNCLRLGRDCEYADNVRQAKLEPAIEYEFSNESLRYTAIAPATASSSRTVPNVNHWASDTVPYHENQPSYHRQLLHQQTQLSAQAPIPDMCKSYMNNYTPIFYSIAEKFPFAYHALISNAAFAVHCATKDPSAEAVAAEEKNAALHGLQVAINNFSLDNADAIISASLCLAWSASDWQNWEVFLSGIARVLDASKDWKDRLLFSGLYQGDFILLNLPPSPSQQQSHQERPLLHQRSKLLQVMSELDQVADKISPEAKQLAGFDQLPTLRSTIDMGFRAQNASEAFKSLSLLRQWMFWITLTPCHNVDEIRLIFLAQFYLIVWSSVPIFPRHFGVHIASTCSRLIQGLKRHPALPHNVSRALSELA